MGKPTYTALAAKRLIHALTEGLLTLLSKGQALIEERRLKLKELAEVNANNPDFQEISQDHVLDLRYKLYVVCFSIICCIDYLVLLNAMTILCQRMGLPKFIKWIAPTFLIIVEVIVSFMIKSGSQSRSLSSKYLQYFVIIFLGGCTILSCIYAAAGYNSDFDHAAFSSYFIVIVIYYIVLFLFSMFLHIWLIQHSEEMVLAFAYLSYRRHHGSLDKRIKDIDITTRGKYTPAFTKKAVALVKAIDEYKRSYPQWPEDFTSSMTNELIDTVNAVMGKEVFRKMHNNNSINGGKNS